MSNLRLRVGNTYYRVTFADRDMTMPGVEPLVYIGDGTGEDGEPFHAFQDTISYVRYGSRLVPGSSDRDDLLVYLLPATEIGVDLLDLKSLAVLVQDCIQRAAATGWPVLPVLRDGWFAAT